MYLIDTNILIQGFIKNTPESKFLNRIARKGDLYLSVLSIAEFLTKTTPDEEKQFEKALKVLKIIDVNEKECRVAAAYRKKHMKNSKSLLVDYILAAQAKINSLILVTNNTRDFPMKDIKVISPN